MRGRQPPERGPGQPGVAAGGGRPRLEPTDSHAGRVHGGEIALTFADDRRSTAKWSTLGIDAQSFSDISPANFDVVDLGREIPATFDCVRNP